MCVYSKVYVQFVRLIELGFGVFGFILVTRKKEEKINIYLEKIYIML